jgi:hypothetical protein
MSEHVESRLSPALLAQRAALRRAEPSAALYARFDRSLESWRTQRVRAVRQRRVSWTLAAAVTVVLVVSTAWVVMHVGTRPTRAVPGDSEYARVASADATVLRVRASLGAQLTDRNGNGFPVRRRNYWVEVGVAGDGTLRIERVTPIDEDPQLFVP